MADGKQEIVFFAEVKHNCEKIWYKNFDSLTVWMPVFLHHDVSL